MELLDRYLKAVKMFLPKAQQDDIIDELSENIVSQMEDREAELGRPLREDEQEAILKQLGHPLLVSSRYHLQVQQLIGPVVFPFYWFVLKSLLWISVGVYSVISIAMLASGEPISSILRAILQYPHAALPAFGWVTLEFAVLDLLQARFRLVEKLTRWSPRSLPPVVKQAQEIPHSRSVFGLVSGAIFILWWLAVPYYPYLILGPADSTLKLADGWQALYVPILLLAAAGVAEHCVTLIRPHWTRIHIVASLAIQSLGLAFVYFFLKAHSFVVIVEASKPMPQYQRLADIVNGTVSVTLWLTFLPWAAMFCGICAVKVIRSVLRLSRRQHNYLQPSVL